MFYKKILVVTDRYPPDVNGGAELSLHRIIRDANYHDKKVYIAALSNRVDRVEKDEYEGIEVYRIPFGDSWPIDDGLPRQKRVVAIARAMVLNLLKGRPTYLIKFMVWWVMRRIRPETSGLFPLFDREMLLENSCIRDLKNLVRSIRPDVVHADNYRSIVLANNLNTDIPVLSLVRDNRFFCAHRNQATNVKGRICQKCDFNCVDEKVSGVLGSTIKHFMQESRSIRVNALTRSQTIIVTSNFLEKQVSQVARAKDILKIPNISESVDWVQSRIAGIQPIAPPQIICVGMVGHNKGQILLCSLMSELKKEIGDYQILIAGRGQQLKRLRELACEQGLEESLILPGFMGREELFIEYARSSVVVCPTIWPEPFGRVPLEAGCVGRPIVAFSVGGLTENIVHEETGLLVPPGDKQALRQALVKVLLDKELARSMGERSLLLARERQQRIKAGRELNEEWSRLA